MVDAINSRLAHGGPTDDITQAGVLIRTFDEITHPELPWLPCPMTWKDRRLSCGKFGDRFPSTIIYPGKTDIYSKGEGGFIIRPTEVDMLCSYDHDGLTMKPEKLCNPLGLSDTCVPGCGWERCPEDKAWRCAWPADRLQQMMEAHQSRTGRAIDHNEVCGRRSSSTTRMWIVCPTHAIFFRLLSRLFWKQVAGSAISREQSRRYSTYTRLMTFTGGGQRLYTEPSWRRMGLQLP